MRAIIAEGLGTYFLVLAGCGAIGAGGSAVAVSLAFAFVILVLVYALGHLSGAQFNPAITVAFAAAGHFPWRRAPAYIGSQLAGATLAALTLRYVLGYVPGVTTTALPPVQAVLVEALATFLLALVIVSVATDDRAPRAAGGLAIGLAVGVGALFAGPLTGGSMNPARSLGPAIVAGEPAWSWLYVLAPVLGAVAGMVSYTWLRGPRVGPREEARA